MCLAQVLLTEHTSQAIALAMVSGLVASIVAAAGRAGNSGPTGTDIDGDRLEVDGCFAGPVDCFLFAFTSDELPLQPRAAYLTGCMVSSRPVEAVSTISDSVVTRLPPAKRRRHHSSVSSMSVSTIDMRCGTVIKVADSNRSPSETDWSSVDSNDLFGSPCHSIMDLWDLDKVLATMSDDSYLPCEVLANLATFLPKFELVQFGRLSHDSLRAARPVLSESLAPESVLLASMRIATQPGVRRTPPRTAIAIGTHVAGPYQVNTLIGTVICECLAFHEIMNLAMCTFGTHTFACNHVEEILFGPELSRGNPPIAPAARLWLVESLYTWADTSARDAALEEAERMQALEDAILDVELLALQFDELMVSDVDWWQ